jgi:ParB-like chromosome segregation protein Spo0J
MNTRLRRDGEIVTPKPDYVLPDLQSLCVPIDAIDPDPENVNKHTPEQIRDLRESLRVFKQHHPLVVQPKGGRLVCRIGNGRLEAARLEGWDYIAVVRADSDDDVRAMARAIRDNTSTWGSVFDEVELQSQLRKIDDKDPHLAAGLGWDADSLERMLVASFDDGESTAVFHGPTADSLATALEAAVPANLRASPARVAALKQSDSNEWYTPSAVIEAARTVMGSIDLDPASCAEANTVVGASQYYTESVDGFGVDWEGNVWLNPPYGFSEGNVSNTQRWSHRLVEQYEDGIVGQACLLVNGSFGYKWFRPLWSFPICFFYSRIAFTAPSGVDNKHHPTHSNVVVYMGDRTTRFIEVFGQFGRVVVPAGTHGVGQ